MTKIRRLTALTKAGIIEALQFRLGTAVMLFGNLIYLALYVFSGRRSMIRAASAW